MYCVTNKCFLFFFGFTFYSEITAETLVSSSYYRQQNASDSAVKEFNTEFPKLEKTNTKTCSPRTHP